MVPRQHVSVPLEAILRATSENGDEIVDPSEDALFLLFEDLERGFGTWLIVEDLRDPSGQSYAQALRLEDGAYVVEYRAGSPAEHFGTRVASLREAHRVITGWAFDLPGWRDGRAWEPVVVR